MNDAGYDVADYRDIDPLFGTLADADALMRDGPRARALKVHRRPRAQPHLRRARVVPGRAGGRPRVSPERGALHLPRRPGPGRRASRRTTGRRSSAARPGPGSPRPTARPASGTCTSSTSPSPTSTGRTRRCAPSSTTSCGSGSTAASTASGSTSPTAWSRPGAAGLARQPSTTGRRRRRHRRGATRDASDGDVPTQPRRADVGPGRRARDLPRLAPGARRPTTADRDPVRRGVGRRRPTGSPRYVRPDEMHQAFNFDFLDAHWDAPALRTRHRRRRCGLRDASGAPTTWVLSNHDVVRHASRLGLPTSRCRAPTAIRADGPAARRRARPAPRPRRHAADARAARRRLPLPGRGARPARAHRPARRRAPGPDVLPHRRRATPAATAAGCRSRGQAAGPRSASARRRRRGCRSRPPTRDLAVDRQEGVAGLDARAVPHAARPRRAYALGSGSLEWLDGYATTRTSSPSVRRDRATSSCWSTSGAAPVALPAGAQVLAASEEITSGSVPTDTAVWFTA